MTQRKKQYEPLAVQVAREIAKPIILHEWGYEEQRYRVVATSTEIVCERFDGEDAMGATRWKLMARAVRGAWNDGDAAESVRTTRALLLGFESLLAVARERAP